MDDPKKALEALRRETREKLRHDIKGVERLEGCVDEVALQKWIRSEIERHGGVTPYEAPEE